MTVHVNAAPPFCVRPTTESCHGKWHEMVEMKDSDSPFQGISAGSGAYLVPSSVDLNKDGKSDMIIGNGDGVILYFLNTGTATNPSFTQKVGVDSPFDGVDVGSHAASFLIDLDRDDDYDMVVGNAEGVLKYFQNIGSSTSAVFEQQTGTSNPFRDVSVGTFASPFVLSTTDKLSFDLYVGNGAGIIFLYKSIGVGSTFVFKLQTGDDNPLDGIDVGNNAAPLAMDADNDGDIDVYVGNGDGKMPYFQNTGSLTNPVYTQQVGSFNPFDGVEISRGGRGVAVERRDFAVPFSIDIDSDGHLDMLIGNQDQLLFYKNSATLSNPTFLELKGSDNPFSSVNVFENSVPTAFDADNDGDIDMLIGVNVINPKGDTGLIYYFKNVGNSVNPFYEEQKGTKNPFHNILLGPLPAPASVDIDSDGDFDVFVGKKDGKIAYFENTGSPTSPMFTKRTGAANPFDGIDVGDNASPFAADMDQDEDFDFFIGNAAGQILFFKNTGTKSLPAFILMTGKANPFPDKPLNTAAAPFCIDADVDGDIDMFVGNGEGEIWYLENIGTTSSPNFKYQHKNNPFFGTDVGDFATPFGVDVNTMYIGNLEGQLLTFSRSRCAPTPRCSGRGRCVYSPTGSSCECIEGESDGPHCEHCPLGKIEGQYESGQNIDLIIPPKCKSCPAGYWSEQLGFDVAARCQACKAGQYINPDVVLGTSIKDCEHCQPGQSSSAGASVCHRCDLGKYGNKDAGMKDECHHCGMGQYQDSKGQTECIKCDSDTYLDSTSNPSKSDCLPCAQDRSTGISTGNTNIKACICKKSEFFQRDVEVEEGEDEDEEVDLTETLENAKPDGVCVPCPVGGDCSLKNGMRAPEITALPGYWRANSTTVEFTSCVTSLKTLSAAEKRCCPLNNLTNTSICSGMNNSNPDSQCELGYGGPSCMTCVKGYTNADGICSECPGGASVIEVMSPLIGLMFMLFLLFVFIFMKAHREDEEEKRKKKEEHRKKKKKRQDLLNHLHRHNSGLKKEKKGKKKEKKGKKKTEETEEKEEKEETEEEKNKEKQEAEVEEAAEVDLEATSEQLRLLGDQMLIARMQQDSNGAYRSDTQVIVDRIKIIYGWMQIFSSMTFTFDIQWPVQLRAFSLGLNFINLDLGNILAGSACNFAVPFLDKMLVHTMIPLMLLITILLARLPAYFLRKNHRQMQHAVVMKTLISVALIVYPGLCTRLFASIKTVSVRGLASNHHSGVVLSVDYGVEAFKSEHMPYFYLTIVCMGIYVIGIPLAVFLVLKANLKYLHTEGDTEEDKIKHEDCVAEVGTLYLQYEPKYWYWEVIVIFQKMMLTGAMTIIAPGSSAQLAVAILFIMTNLSLVLKAGPFVDDADDYLATLTTVQMFMTLLGGLLLMTDDPSSPTYDADFMGVSLVVINSFGFIALVLSLVAMHPKVRKCLNDGGKKKKKKNTMKVFPTGNGTIDTRKPSSTQVLPIAVINRQEGELSKSGNIPPPYPPPKPPPGGPRFFS